MNQLRPGIGIGIDFGTSNSTAAWFDGHTLHSVRLEHGSSVLPTAIHLDREFAALTGAEAMQQYVNENRGRRVELVAEVIGEAASGIGEIDNEISGELETQRRTLYGPLTDRGQPGRLFLGLKRLLGDVEHERLPVFGRHFRLVALLTPILLRIRQTLQRELRGPLPAVHLGRPVQFEGRDAQASTLAVARLAEAAGHAGLVDHQFYPEPIAATLSWLWRSQPGKPGVALAVDFGGGTLDLALLRHDGMRFTVLGTAGAAMGGDKIDQLIYRTLLFPALGKGERWQRVVDGYSVDTLFPFEEFETGLLNWPITHTLNQNRTRTMVIDRMAKADAASEKFQRLLDLISYNYGYTCFQAIRTAKAALSDVTDTFIDIPEINLRLPFSRSQFEALLLEPLAILRQLIDQVLAQAGLQAQDVDMVVRTGGTSQIVAVRQLLEELFEGRVVAHDPFTSVAAGLAIASHHGWRYES